MTDKVSPVTVHGIALPDLGSIRKQECSLCGPMDHMIVLGQENRRKVNRHWRTTQPIGTQCCRCGNWTEIAFVPLDDDA